MTTPPQKKQTKKTPLFSPTAYPTISVHVLTSQLCEKNSNLMRTSAADASMFPHRLTIQTPTGAKRVDRALILERLLNPLEQANMLL